MSNKTEKMTSEARSAALSIRAKLNKAQGVDGFDLTAAEIKQLQAIVARITKAITPAKKAKAAKKDKKAKADKPAAAKKPRTAKQKAATKRMLAAKAAKADEALAEAA